MKTKTIMRLGSTFFGLIFLSLRRSPFVFVLFATCSCHCTVTASTPGDDIVHETVTLADLLTSQGIGATEIASHDKLDDAGNTAITHTLVGGYHATTVAVSGTIRGDNADANWFRDARIQISPPSGGLPFLAMTSEATQVTAVGQIDVFENVVSETLPEQSSGWGQPIAAGPAVFQFYELNDDKVNGNDNSFTDLKIEFVENRANNGMFPLGTLSSGVAYSNDTHSHVPGGLDLFTFSVPSVGKVDLVTSESENGEFGFDITDTEIGLFDSAGLLIAQGDDVGGDGYAGIFDFSLPAGDYTIVTTSFDSSLNDTMIVGDDISFVTGGMWDGDYGLSVTFTPNGGGGFAVCDFDTDGDCDTLDIDSLYENFGSSASSFDLDASGTVDTGDVLPWLAAASASSNPFNTNDATFKLGDLDFDGKVNSTDLGLLLNNFGNSAGLKYGAGNLNDDALVNSSDLGLLLNNFGFLSTGASVVPEPTTGWLVLMAGLVLLRRRRR